MALQLKEDIEELLIKHGEKPEELKRIQRKENQILKVARDVFSGPICSSEIQGEESPNGNLPTIFDMDKERIRGSLIEDGQQIVIVCDCT